MVVKTLLIETLNLNTYFACMVVWNLFTGHSFLLIWLVSCSYSTNCNLCL